MSKHAYILRIVLVYVGFICCFLVLARHLHWLQIVRHEELSEKARKTYTAQRSRRGRRGDIVDRRGNRLVGDLACKDILAEPRRMPLDQQPYIRDLLAERLHVGAPILNARFSSGRIEVVVRNGVDLGVARSLEELQLPGLRFVDSTRRYYPKAGLLANVLGFTDTRNQGAYGIEATWDEVLRPREISNVYERDRKGRKLHRRAPQADGEPLHGHTVWLTIDEPLQTIVEAELDELVREHKPRFAYAIMADPRSGEVLAMAQRPSFNPNDRSTMDPDAWRLHLLSDVYDPGSTMKPIAIAGAIDYGVVTLEDIFDCEGGRWYYAGRPLRDSGHHYQDLPVSLILAKSSNIGTAKIALRMGRGRLYQTLRRFGFGSPTGIGLEPESPGILRHPRDWDKLSITRFPIGQGVSVTAVQMVQAYCALAAGGAVPQLHVVKRVTDCRGRLVTEVKPHVRHRAVRPDAAADVVRAMCLVTRDGGTAKRAAIPGYATAGKTGTSQKCINGSYVGHGKYVASFIGFVPATRPAFVLLVVADEPSGRSYYGGTVCGPTFKRISVQALRYMNVLPADHTPPVVVRADP